MSDPFSAKAALMLIDKLLYRLRPLEVKHEEVTKETTVTGSDLRKMEES